MADMLERLLWDPLPDPQPPAEPGLLGRLRHLLSPMRGEPDTSRLSGQQLQELVERRVRRGAVQALVRKAYLATVAEQDTAHRKPDAFIRAWKAHLVALIDRPSDDLSGWWSERTITHSDVQLAWRLYEVASQARQRAIERARATRSKRLHVDSRQAPIFEFLVVGDGAELGGVKYGVCSSCRIGLLYKIGFPDDWQFCGLGRLALTHMEARHPDLTWYTTGQHKHARGFYTRYRQHSASPWTDEQHPCPHLK